MSETKIITCKKCGTSAIQTTQDNGDLNIDGNGKTVVFGLVDGRLSAYRCMKCGNIWLPEELKSQISKMNLSKKAPVISMKPKFKVSGKRGPARNETGEYIYEDLWPEEKDNFWIKIVCKHCKNEQFYEVNMQSRKLYVACNKCGKPLANSIEDLQKILAVKDTEMRLEFHDLEIEDQIVYKTICPKCGNINRFVTEEGATAHRLTCICGLRIEARLPKKEQ